MYEYTGIVICFIISHTGLNLYINTKYKTKSEIIGNNHFLPTYLGQEIQKSKISEIYIYISIYIFH